MTKETEICNSEEIQGQDPQNSSRRKAVKTIAGLVGAVTAYHVVPNNWSTPIIKQVFIPAHAATSGLTIYDPCTSSLAGGDRSTSSVSVRVDGFVTPSVSGLTTTITATPAGAGSPVTVTTTTNSEGRYGATITIAGGPGITAVALVVQVEGAVNTGNCSVKIPAEGEEPDPTTTVSSTETPTTEGPTLPPTSSTFLPPTSSTFLP